MGRQTTVVIVVVVGSSTANGFHGGGVRPLPHAAAVDGGQGSRSAATGGGIPVVVLVLIMMLPPLLLVLLMMVLVGKVILVGRVEGGVVTLGLLEQDAAALVGRNAVQIVLVVVVKVVQRWPMTPCPRPAGATAAHVGGTAARNRTHVGLMRRHRRQWTWRHVRDGPGRPNSSRHLPVTAMVGCCILPTDASCVGREERRRYRL